MSDGNPVLDWFALIFYAGIAGCLLSGVVEAVAAAWPRRRGSAR
jgi:hypothetical protein